MGRSRKRKPADDADSVDVDGVRKRRRTDEMGKTVAHHSRTTRCKKRKLPADEDAVEPKWKTEEKVAGRSDSSRDDTKHETQARSR